MSEKANLQATAVILKRAFIIVYQILPLILLCSASSFAAYLVGRKWTSMAITLTGFFVSMGILGIVKRKIWETPISLPSFFRDCLKYGVRIGALTVCWSLIGIFIALVAYYAHIGASMFIPNRLNPLICGLALVVLSPLLWFGTAVGIHVRFFKIFKGIYTFIRIGGREYPYIIFLTFFWAYFSFAVSQLEEFRVLATGQISLYKVLFMGFYWLICSVLGMTMTAALILVYKKTGQPVDEKSALIQVPKDFSEAYSREAE